MVAVTVWCSARELKARRVNGLPCIRDVWRRDCGPEGAAPHHLVGAIPVYLNKGDALLFVDGCMHGGSSRVNPGERRVTIYRYGPVWGANRFGYQTSPETLAKLTPSQRAIMQPVPPIFPT